MSRLAIQLAIVGAALAALVAGGIYVVGLIRNDGAAAAIDTINRQNQEAGHAADNARARFDGCSDGVFFDFATGQCAGAADDRRH